MYIHYVIAYTTVVVWNLPVVSPAVDQYRLVTSLPLNLVHLFYRIYDTAEVGAVAIRTPVGHVQLYNLTGLPQLRMMQRSIAEITLKQ